MFALTKQAAKLSNVNPRAETHGDEKELACDIKFEVSSANTLLDVLEPGLREAFYRSTVKDPHPTSLPDLRFPWIGTVPYGKELTGYTVIVAHGIDESSAIELDGCDVNNFRLDMQEGGTVSIAFRVQFHPDWESIGLLCEKIQQDVELTLIPPKPVGDLATQVDSDATEEAPA